jgi:glycosyltransferase involved in cell wall biosynthesis
MQKRLTKPIIFSLLDTPAFGGAEQYLLSHLHYLSTRGYSIIVASNNAHVRKMYQEFVTTHQAHNFEVIEAPYVLDAIGNWKGLVKFFWSAPAAMRWCWVTLRNLTQKQPVICYLPGFSDRLLFSPLIKHLQIALIWIEIGPLAPTFTHNWGFPKLLYRLTQDCPDHFVTTSLFTKKSMITDGKIDPDQITLIYPGVKTPSLSELKKLKTLSQSWLKKHKLLKKTIITYVGRLASENEVELVIEALADLKQRHQVAEHNLHVLIIGDGPERARFQNLAKSLGVSSDITFTGFVDEETKYSLLAASDIFTFTRAWELDGFGMTTIEAMAHQVAVITSDFGPQPEIVSDAKNGLLFEPHSAKSLSQKIELLATRPKLRQQLGKRGYEFVKTTFGSSKLLKRVEKVVKNKIKQKSGGKINLTT